MLRKIFGHQGRMKRRDYALVTIPLYIINVSIGSTIDFTIEFTEDVPTLLFLIILTISITVILVFQIIKRLHDLNLADIYWLLIFIPILNIGFLFWLLFKDGSVGANKYGDDPKGR